MSLSAQAEWYKSMKLYLSLSYHIVLDFTFIFPPKFWCVNHGDYKSVNEQDPGSKMPNPQGTLSKETLVATFEAGSALLTVALLSVSTFNHKRVHVTFTAIWCPQSKLINKQYKPPLTLKSSPDGTKHSGRHHVTVSMVWLMATYLHPSVQKMPCISNLWYSITWSPYLRYSEHLRDSYASQTPHEAHSFK